MFGLDLGFITCHINIEFIIGFIFGVFIGYLIQKILNTKVFKDGYDLVHKYRLEIARLKKKKEILSKEFANYLSDTLIVKANKDKKE